MLDHVITVWQYVSEALKSIRCSHENVQPVDLLGLRSKNQNVNNIQISFSNSELRTASTMIHQ